MMDTTLRFYHGDIALSILLVATLVAHAFGVSTFLGAHTMLIIALIAVVPVLIGAYESVKEGEWASMDTLASIALVFSLLSGEYVSAIFIELMLAAARILDDVTRDNTEKSIRGLLKLRPAVAKVERADGTVGETALTGVHVGDTVLVGIGEHIPVDGIVISGSAAVNESSLTGESLPVDKSEGSEVMSATLVESGSLRIRAVRVGNDTTLERVIALIETARDEKPTTQTLGEKFGKWYLITILLGSGVMYLLTHNLPLVLAVVLVVCADDIAVAIPIAYLRAIRAAARHGVILKGARHLETLGSITTIIFDKTGTLTTGKLSIAHIVPFGTHDAGEVARYAVSAAHYSSHPLARALIAYGHAQSVAALPASATEEKGGRGIVATIGGAQVLLGRKVLLEEMGVAVSDELERLTEPYAGKGQSISYVTQGGTVLGFITAQDTIKENAKHALAQLRKLGVKRLVMLSGDNGKVAETVARELAIDEWHGDLLPQDKLAIIRELQAKEHVAMVGDGVNDAAALSLASVGIAMGGLGSEGAIESAQVVLMRDNLMALPLIIRLARTTRRVAIQDFGIWGATNSLGLLLVFGGIIGPAGAAAYNFLSDFLPLFNSLKVRVRT